MRLSEFDGKVELPSVVVGSVDELMVLLLDLLDIDGDGTSWKGGGGGIKGTGGGEADVDGMLLNLARIAGMGVATAMGKGGGGAK